MTVIPAPLIRKHNEEVVLVRGGGKPHTECVGTFKQQLLRVCGTPAAVAPAYGLSWGHIKLREAASFLDNDVQDKDMISLPVPCGDMAQLGVDVGWRKCCAVALCSPPVL